MEPVFGAGLSNAEKQRISEQIRARPYEYVAQEQVALSTAPVWDQGRMYPRSLVLRTYVLNTGSGWIAMPGGLVRVAEADGQVVSMQRGGRSKDAWVSVGWTGRHFQHAASQEPAGPTAAHARRTCQAARRTTFSGWVVTRNGRSPLPACCGA